MLVNHITLIFNQNDMTINFNLIFLLAIKKPLSCITSRHKNPMPCALWLTWSSKALQWWTVQREMGLMTKSTVQNIIHQSAHIPGLFSNNRLVGIRAWVSKYINIWWDIVTRDLALIATYLKCHLLQYGWLIPAHSFIQMLIFFHAA